MGRKKLADVPKLNITAIRKASNGLGLVKKVADSLQNKTESLYPVTECLQFLKNMYTKPTYKELTITNYAWTKLMAFIHLVGPYEISGFGRIQDGKVTDFDIIRQEVKSAYVESDADAVLEFIMKVPPEQRTEWTLDWHSHVDMATTPSSTDWTNYYEMLNARQQKQFPAMIVNKKGYVTANQIICENKHSEIKIFVETEPLEDAEIEELYKVCKEKVEHYCTKAPVVTSYTNTRWGATSPYGSSSYYDDYDYGYDYDYADSQKKTIEDSSDSECRVNAFDLSPEQIRKMEADGIVFDPDTGEAYEEDECCSTCHKPLKTETELDYGVCLDCFQKALNEEALAYHHQNS